MGGLNVGTSNASSSTNLVGSNWTPQQWALWQSLAGQLQTGIGGPAPSYPGQMYAPVNQQESEYLNYASGNAGARQAAVGRLLSGQLTPEQQALYTDRAAIDSYYNNAIRNPALREFNEVTLPGVREEYAGPGYWGSARASAGAKARENLATDLASKRAALEYQNRADYAAAMENAINRQGTGMQAAATESSIMGTAGQYARSIENEKIAANLQRWLMGEGVADENGNISYNAAYNPYMALVFSALGMTPYVYGTQSSSSGLNLGVNIASSSPAAANSGGSQG